MFAIIVVVVIIIIYNYMPVSHKAGRPLTAMVMSHPAMYSKPPQPGTEEELCAYLEISKKHRCGNQPLTWPLPNIPQ